MAKGAAALLVPIAPVCQEDGGGREEGVRTAAYLVDVILHHGEDLSRGRGIPFTGTAGETDWNQQEEEGSCTSGGQVLGPPFKARDSSLEARGEISLLKIIRD